MKWVIFWSSYIKMHIWHRSYFGRIALSSVLLNLFHVSILMNKLKRKAKGFFFQHIRSLILSNNQSLYIQFMLHKHENKNRAKNSLHNLIFLEKHFIIGNVYDAFFITVSPPSLGHTCLSFDNVFICRSNGKLDIFITPCDDNNHF